MKDATKEPRSLGVRLALTVLPVVALFVASAKVLLPGLGDEALIRRIAEQSPFAVAANVSIFAVGVMPFIYGYFFVELVALASKRLRRLRHGNPEGRAKLERWARGVGLVLAIIQAWGVASSLAALSSSDFLTNTMPSVSEPLVVATLVGGSCVALLVADLVTRQGIVNGLLLLPAADLVVQSASEIRIGHAKATAAGLWEPRHSFVVLGSIALALVAGWAATRGAHDRPEDGASKDGERTAYRDARALAVEPWVPVPSSSISAYTLTTSVLMLPATLANFKVPVSGLRDVLERGEATFWMAFVVIVGVFVFVLTRMLHRPSDAEDLARRLGTSVDKARVIAAQNRALVPTLMFFAAVIVAGAALGKVPFLRVSLSLFPIVAALGIDAFHAMRTPAGYVGIWQERRAAAVPVVRAALEARGIETRVTGAATHAMVQAFAPYAPVTIHVPVADAERATKILRHLLLGEEAPEATPDAPKRKRDEPTHPGWTTRKRLVALAAVVLAACGLFAVGSMRPPAPPVRTPAKLELVVVDDSSDVLSRIPDSDLPPGIDMRFENAPIGVDEMGNRHSTRVSFVSVDMRPGEPDVAAAMARGEAWAKTVTLPPGKRIAWEVTEDYDPDTAIAKPNGVRSFVVEKEARLTNADIEDATAAMDTRSGVPEAYVAITLTPDAAERFRALTAANVNRRIAILLDGVVNSAPVVRQEIAGGRLSITMGAGDPEKALKQARELAGGLRQR